MNTCKILSRALMKEGIDSFLNKVSLESNITVNELLEKILNKRETTIDDVENIATELDIGVDDYLEYFFCS